MEIIILGSTEEIGEVAADLVADVLDHSERPVLGLATGSSPVTAYEALAARTRSGDLSLADIDAFALDEYVGLPADHPQSYSTFLRENVVVPLGLDPTRVHVPDGQAEELEAACASYERAIDDVGGVDLQILGIGANGHIGFNEPTSSLESRTRIKTLAPQTRQDNARFFEGIDQVPTLCVTQGLGTISAAGTLMMIAEGEHKARAVAAAVEGPLSAMCPASLLQVHRRAVVILDEAAASSLRLADYYRYVYANKPDWQRPGRRTDVPSSNDPSRRTA